MKAFLKNILIELRLQLIKKKMKKITMFALLIASSVLQLSAQTWVNWDVNVPQEKQEEMMVMWNTFMETKTGKALPYNFMSQLEMGEATHNMSLSFIGDDADALAALFDYDAIMQNPDFAKPFMWFGQNVEPHRTQTGYQIAGSEQKGGNFYQALWGIEVADPATTAAAFVDLIVDTKPLLEEYNVDISIHQALAGQEGAISHYILGNFKDYVTFLKASQAMYQSPGFAKFAQATSANVNPLTTTRMLMGAWNTGE